MLGPSQTLQREMRAIQALFDSADFTGAERRIRLLTGNEPYLARVKDHLANTKNLFQGEFGTALANLERIRGEWGENIHIWIDISACQ